MELVVRHQRPQGMQGRNRHVFDVGCNQDVVAAFFLRHVATPNAEARRRRGPVAIIVGTGLSRPTRRHVSGT